MHRKMHKNHQLCLMTLNQMMMDSAVDEEPDEHQVSEYEDSFTDETLNLISARDSTGSKFKKFNGTLISQILIIMPSN